ncbi:MAG TPA: hypothetical protein VGP87_16515 [Gemmatimonadales bacterium]|nr:hypothetical protein [Gemmatimonadales bacterium]
MSKLYRSLLWSGLVVAGVAACGDDVTVQPPPPPVTTVRSVSVTPNPGNILPGGTLQMSAAVDADAGLPTTVNWTSTNPAVVSVNATSGLATAIAAAVPGTTVGIQACSTATGFTGVCGQSTVTVATGASVTSVVVTPGPSVDFVVGQAPVTFVAAVIGSGNPSQTVTWSIADGSTDVITVGAATGIVTVVGAGSHKVVKACAVAAPTVCGSTDVTVSVAAPTQVSLVSIDKGGLHVPLDSVSGQVDVTVNVDPGAGSLVAVQVLIDGVVAAEQCFIGTCPVLLRAKPPVGKAVQPVVLSFNTAQVRKLSNGLFIPVAFNGPRQFSAKLFTSLTTSGLSSNAIPVVLKNQDALIGTPAFSLVAATPANTAGGNLASGGAAWFGGNVNFTGGNFVSFFPVSPASASWSATGGCSASGDATSGDPLTGITFSGTWDCSGVEGAVGLGTLTLTPGTAPAADVVDIPFSGYSTVGTLFLVNGDERYNLFPTASTPSPTVVFIDNVGPTITPNEIGFVAGCFVGNLTFPVPGCWINASYNLAGDFPATDGGSGVASVNTFSYDPSSFPLVCTSSTLTPASAAEDPSPTKYNACAQAADNLGNISTAFGLNAFGVDKTPPTIVYSGTYPSDSTVTNAIPAQTIDYSVNDNNSGLDDNALTLDLTTLIADAAPSCASGSIAATLAPGAPNTPRSMLTPIPSPDNACGDQGYYTWTASVTDRAGNTTFPVAPNNPVVFALDRTAPEIQTVAPQPLYAANQDAKFLVFATDSTDLAGVRIEVRYNATGGTLVDLGYNITSGFGTVWDNVLTTITTPPTGFPAVIPGTQVFGSFVIDTTVALGGPADELIQASVTAFDFFPNTSAPFVVAIPAVYKDNTQFPAAGDPNPWATTGIFAGATFSGALTACTYTYDTPSNGPTIPTRVLVANEISAGPPIVLDILAEIVTTGTGLGATDNPKLISDNGTFRRYQYTVSASDCPTLQGAGTLRLIAVKGSGAGLSAYLVP